MRIGNLQPDNAFRSIYLACTLPFIFMGAGAALGQRSTNPPYAFSTLYPAFLNTGITPAYSEYVSPTSPAIYDPTAGDFESQFTSPSGKQVTVVVKSPVTTAEYDVPPISPNETVADYLNNAFLSGSQPRTKTIIKFPKGTYSFDYPLYSNASGRYVHWQIPSGATDLVVDGQSSTVNFSDLALGLNLPNVNRVTLKNFTFAWPSLQVASVGTVTAVGGNASDGYTYDLTTSLESSATLPKMLAATTSWDLTDQYWDLANINDDVSYGDGVDSGFPLKWVKTATKSTGGQTTVEYSAANIPGYGVRLTVGESVLLRYYDFASAISVSGQDVTLDNVILKNVIGTGFSFGQGRGFRITDSVLTRMSGQPISGTGNCTMFANGVSGDVVIDHCAFGYQGDDAFDMNSQIIRFSPGPVNNSTPMVTYQFTAGSLSNQLEWPAYATVQAGDKIALFDPAMAFKGMATIEGIVAPANASNNILYLNKDISPALAKTGFIATDLTYSAGARYFISDNVFQFNRARALLLQTPFGWVDHNLFTGQTLKSVYVLASKYWGEGAGAQELIISDNLFRSMGHANQDFLALDIMAEAADFPNNEDEVTGSNSAAPAINQNIVAVNNIFTSDEITAVVNISSANNVVFSGNVFDLAQSLGPAETDQYPISIHDASNIYFSNNDAYNRNWLLAATVTNSRLLGLSSPPPVVARFLPAACGIPATTSNVIFQKANGN